MSRSHAARSDVPGAFEMPPSTMAAALISNISTSKAPHLIPQDDLQKVMAEVSRRENGMEKLSEEQKLDHKHKLIYVFARAVLEKLAKDDPIEKMKLLSLEALDILTSTIVEIPAVLLFTEDSESMLQYRGREPLWLWLFPRLLTLLGRRSCSTLTCRIREFFFTVFDVLTTSPKLWHMISSVFLYFKSCTACPSIIHTWERSLLTLDI